MKKKNQNVIVYKSVDEFAKSIGRSAAEIAESKLKLKLLTAIRGEVSRRKLSHEQTAKLAGVARTNITGIISGSITSITLNRMVRIASALGLSMDLQIKRAS